MISLCDLLRGFLRIEIYGRSRFWACANACCSNFDRARSYILFRCSIKVSRIYSSRSSIIRIRAFLARPSDTRLLNYVKFFDVSSGCSVLKYVTVGIAATNLIRVGNDISRQSTRKFPNAIRDQFFLLFGTVSRRKEKRSKTIFKIREVGPSDVTPTKLYIRQAGEGGGGGGARKERSELVQASVQASEYEQATKIPVLKLKLVDYFLGRLKTR